MQGNIVGMGDIQRLPGTVYCRTKKEREGKRKKLRVESKMRCIGGKRGQEQGLRTH